MLSVQDARALALKNCIRKPAHLRHIVDALHYSLAQDVLATASLPGFDNSQMDGYAVCSGDFTADSTVLPRAFTVPAGSVLSHALKPGQCARIFTGAPIPDGADAVIAQEDTSEEDGQVCFRVKPRPGQFIRKMGSDIREGEVLFAEKERLSAPKIGVLASQGMYQVEVIQKPSVGYILSGDELALEGEELVPGGIRSSNGEIFEALLGRFAQEVTGYGKVGDSLEELETRLELATQHDLFLISGGASVGERDFTKTALKNQGWEILFERIALRPGKPLVMARKDHTLLFGVPGNPVSTYVTALLFLVPVCLKMAGAQIGDKRIWAVLEEDIKKPRGLMTCLRGQFSSQENELIVSTRLNQNSGALGAMARANCLVLLDEDMQEISRGTRVPVLPLDDGMEWI